MSGGTALWFMQSSGGLASAERFGGRDAILSGPAGGVVAAARTAEAAGFAEVIGFDMGGTSTDVALYCGRFERVFDATIAGVEMRVPSMAIETVAAGGGSILHAGSGRARVGPDSAGADPGPACYRRGGPLTVTDANLLCGRLDPAHFPALFGPNGDQPLDRAVVERGFARLAAELAGSPAGRPAGVPTDAPTAAPADPPTDAPADAPTDTPTAAPADAPTDAPADAPTDAPADTPTDVPSAAPTGAAAGLSSGIPAGTPASTPAGTLNGIASGTSSGPHAAASSSPQAVTAAGLAAGPRAVAEGFLDVAVANMAAAIRRVALEKGRDAAGFTLQCFGGAGGQLACRVAEALGMRTVLVHPLAGVLSAFGMGLADRTAIRQRSVERALDDDTPALVATLADELGTQADADLGVPGAHRAVQVLLRYRDTDAALPVPPGSSDGLRRSFETAHRARYGFADAGRPIVVEAVVVEAVLAGPPVALPPLPPRAGERPPPVGTVSLFVGGVSHQAPVHDRATLRPGDRIRGPALIREPIATTVVDPGWALSVRAAGELVIEQHAAAPRAVPDAAIADPVQLELFNTRFMGIAERMGVVLRQTASSVNMKERLDFSCALFDADGRLIANAPHVPVHLGAMGESVRTVLRSRGATLKPGDAVALNNPFNGGTHLPDITVICPVFDAAGERIRFFVANRGHHADIGGLTPGSTPPGSRTLDEEGVVIDDFLLLSDGRLREEAFRALLRDAPWPARSPDTNLADIRAQLAANRAGIVELELLVRRSGWTLVRAYMGHVRAHAEQSMRRVIGRLRDGAFADRLDDGTELCVAVRIDRAQRSAVVDFSGTGAAGPNNFNAPPAVTRAAVLYAFRCLLDEDLPLNEGCMAPLRIVLPPGSILDPPPGSAVVAGNTEISQAVCNALLAALGAQAASQGTMNNLLFGDASRQYYETICGGAGAGPGFGGASAVHTHMTNTRITDPEVLEMRYPVRLDRFAVRRGSGGAGRWPGGDGVERAIVALQPLEATLVSSRRSVPPFGLAGGAPGSPGAQHVERADGTRQVLSGRDRVDLLPGDRLVVLTPGGGGYGPPPVADAPEAGDRA